MEKIFSNLARGPPKSCKIIENALFPCVFVKTDHTKRSHSIETMGFPCVLKGVAALGTRNPCRKYGNDAFPQAGNALFYCVFCKMAPEIVIPRSQNPLFSLCFEQKPMNSVVPVRDLRKFPEYFLEHFWLKSA